MYKEELRMKKLKISTQIIAMTLFSSLLSISYLKFFASYLVREPAATGSATALASELRDQVGSKVSTAKGKLANTAGGIALRFHMAKEQAQFSASQSLENAKARLGQVKADASGKIQNPMENLKTTLQRKLVEAKDALTSRIDQIKSLQSSAEFIQTDGLIIVRQEGRYFSIDVKGKAINRIEPSDDLLQKFSSETERKSFSEMAESLKSKIRERAQDVITEVKLEAEQHGTDAKTATHEALIKFDNEYNEFLARIKQKFEPVIEEDPFKSEGTGHEQ